MAKRGAGHGGRVGEDTSSPHFSPLHRELAARILAMMRDSGAPRGHHLVELDLCRSLGVSRTPVRGALRLLEKRGVVEARPHRGYRLRNAENYTPVGQGDEEAVRGKGDGSGQSLITAIARARRAGQLPDHCSHQDIVRILGSRRLPVERAMRQLVDLGLAERRPGQGWSFLPLPIGDNPLFEESYAFRFMVEPAGLLEGGFTPDPHWLAHVRARHIAFRRRSWTDRLAAELTEADADFHEQLARFSGNRYVLDAVRRQNRLRSFLGNSQEDNAARAMEAVDEHIAIIDALASGEADRASGLMRAHLRNGYTPG